VYVACDEQNAVCTPWLCLALLTSRTLSSDVHHHHHPALAFLPNNCLVFCSDILLSMRRAWRSLIRDDRKAEQTSHREPSSSDAPADALQPIRNVHTFPELGKALKPSRPKDTIPFDQDNEYSQAARKAPSRIDVPTDILHLILELLWRDPAQHGTRWINYCTLSLTSHDISSIIRDLAIRYVRCISRKDLGMYLSIVHRLVLTKPFPALPLPPSIELVVSPLYLCRLKSFREYLDSPYVVDRMLLTLRDSKNLGDYTLFGDTQSLTIIPSTKLKKHVFSWIAQSPSLFRIFFENVRPTSSALVDDAVYVDGESSAHYINTHVTHLATRLSASTTLSNTSIMPFSVIFPEVTTFELYGPFDLSQCHSNAFPPKLTTLVLHAPAGATLSLMKVWWIEGFVKKAMFNYANRSGLHIIFETSDQEPLGWVHAVAGASQIGVTFLRRPTCELCKAT
jgi:hypothetical protein